METWARDLLFSPRPLSLAALRASHPALPVLVKVLEDGSKTRGLCPGQILIFHMWINQERIIGQNSRGGTVSIPVNCSQRFQLQDATKPDTGLLIPNLLKAHKLPLEVQVPEGDAGAGASPRAGVSPAVGSSPGNDNGSSFTWDSFAKMTLVSTHKITYGLASVLTTGEAQVCQLFPVPLCRPLQLQLVTELNVLQAAFLEDHTEQITELLTSLSHHPGQQVCTLPSIGVTDYRELLSGEILLVADCPAGKGAPSLQPKLAPTPAPPPHEQPASSESKHDSLSAAVDRFTHYQQLLSSHSPKNKRRGDNRGKDPSPQPGCAPAAAKASPSRHQFPASPPKPSPSKHQFGPASPSPLASSAGRSLKDGILMMHQSLGVQQPLLAADMKQPKASGKDTTHNGCAATGLH